VQNGGSRPDFRPPARWSACATQRCSNAGSSAAERFTRFDRLSSSRRSQSCCVSLLKRKPRQFSSDLPHRLAPAITILSSPAAPRVTTKGTPRTGHTYLRGAATQLRASYVRSADAHPRDIRHSAWVMRIFRSPPLHKAERHVHDCPVALHAHRKAASLEHIQHGAIFPKDFRDELAKSGFTSAG
jgi:hypothetical protein